MNKAMAAALAAGLMCLLSGRIPLAGQDGSTVAASPVDSWHEICVLRLITL